MAAPAEDAAQNNAEVPPDEEGDAFTGVCPKVLGFLEKEGLLPPEAGEDVFPGDLTRQPLELPAGRDIRLQNLARADEGVLLALAYSTQRGFGSTHPFTGEMRMGEVEVFFTPEELGFPVLVGEVTLTECESVNQFTGGKGRPASFTRGYGLVFGESERKAVSMAIVDRALRAGEFDEEERGPAQNAEFVLYHSDNVEASGFVQHIKLPHYVDFQAELALVRALRGKSEKDRNDAASDI
jgi:alpha-D-ribose 1-methylphosphonate 5-triphosphate synthase subunit PhnI